MNFIRFNEEHRLQNIWEEQLTYKTNNFGEKIMGIFHPIIHWNGGYILTNLIIYKDATIRVGELYNLQEFKDYINRDRILTTENRILKDVNSIVECTSDFGQITISNYKPRYSKEELYKKVEDYIEILNGRPCREQKCHNSFKDYLISDSTENWEKLNKYYHDLPINDRVLYDYVESKDPLCQLIIFKYKLSQLERIELLKEYFENEWKNEVVK